MISTQQNDELITGMDVREFFQDSVQTAVARQQVSVADDTVVYVVNMLTEFTRSDVLYEDTPDGRMIKPRWSTYCRRWQMNSSRNAIRICCGCMKSGC